MYMNSLPLKWKINIRNNIFIFMQRFEYEKTLRRYQFYLFFVGNKIFCKPGKWKTILLQIQIDLTWIKTSLPMFYLIEIYQFELTIQLIKTNSFLSLNSIPNLCHGQYGHVVLKALDLKLKWDKINIQSQGN